MTMRGTAADHIEHWKQVGGPERPTDQPHSNVRCETWREIVTSGSDRAQAAEAELKSK